METIRGALKIIILGCVFSHVSSYCNPAFGPSGNIACVLGEPYYKKYQYATCQTNLYIKLKSDYRHVCRTMADGTQPMYCWNQCMIELYELSEGPVYSNCECNPGGSLTNNPMTTYIKLPGDCYSPNGRNCSWFNKCLRAKYSCNGNNFNDMKRLWFSHMPYSGENNGRERIQMDCICYCMPAALRQNVGLYHNTTVDRSLDNILTNLADVFENGTFQFVVDGEYVEPDTMFACNDYICSDTYLHRNATYPMHQGNTETKSHEEQKHSHATIFGIIIAVFVGSCVAVVCVICLVIRVRLRPSDIRHVILTED
ncbi:Hypothetical predicted protein [Mytilus galloprovincialis]|uniref:Uncharacterized protein n=1 Tax=Mytilus galloprovincialis TaxID=29158 RepID=A0A8B6C2J4_MYTGA|nr:Hypothetical predicted protein [Mytilus galloprovincialis]